MSATVDIGGGKSLNVSEEAKDVAALKKDAQSDLIYPFKKWVKEEPSLAIWQFDNEGKAGYRGFALKEIGGKKYKCQTTGLDGVESAEIAAQNLKICDGISAK